MRIGNCSLAPLLLVLTVCFADVALAQAQYTPPDPPVFKKAPGQSAIENLRDIKLAWLEKKIKAEKRWLERIKKKNAKPDEGSYEKDIKEFGELIAGDEAEVKALTGKDALRPDKDTDAGKHAKILEKNVKFWIAEYGKKKQSAASAADAKEVAANQKEIDGFSDALKEAQKDSPKLFE